MRLLPSFVSIVLLGNISYTASAQNPRPATASPSSTTLLQQLWKKEQTRRVLLILPPPEGYKPFSSNELSPRSVADWLQVNNSVARSFGGITVVADRLMTVPATRLGAPLLSMTNSRKIVLLQLLASLSPEQWQQLASPSGLDSRSLSADQRVLWEQYVPNPFVVERSGIQYKGPEAAFLPKPPANPVRMLTDAERQQVRLRVKLMGTAYAKFGAMSKSYPIVTEKNQFERQRAGEVFLTLREASTSPSPQTDSDTDVIAYGQSLAHSEVNRPKSLPTGFEEHLSTFPIVLTDTGSEKQTVGTLLDAITAASGVKLYASTAFRTQPVTILNTGNIAAGDLLRALLFATQSTVRATPPDTADESPWYTIAPSSEPAGRVAGRITDWYNATQRLQQGGEADANARIAEQSPLMRLSFDADDPMALTDSQKNQVLAAMRQQRDGYANTMFSVPLSDLPLATQTIINANAKDMLLLSSRLQGKVDLRVEVDKIWLRFDPYCSYIVPGSGEMAGEVEGQSVASSTDWLPRAATVTEEAKGRIVILAPESVEEAKTQVNAAREAGVKEVWLQAPPDRIMAAIPLAGTIPVRAVVSLLRVPDSSPQALPRDENIYGKKSSEWLVASDPSVIAYTADQVSRVAHLPGIAGIVLRDAVAPGYRGGNAQSPEAQFWTGEPLVSPQGVGASLGYTLAHRRDYMKATGQDPADIVGTMPVFIGMAEDAVANESWHTWTAKSMASFWHAIRDSVGTTPVLVEGMATFAAADRINRETVALFAPWAGSEPEPPMTILFRHTRANVPPLPDKPAVFIVIAGNSDTRLSPAALVRLTRQEDKPGTTIWDLTDRRAPGSAARLRALKREVPTP